MSNRIESGFAAFMSNTVPGFTYTEQNGVPFWQSVLINKLDSIKHAFSTRKGGISTGVYESMNLSFDRTASLDETKQNYRIACDALGIPVENTVLVNGVHSAVNKRVTVQNCGDGLMQAHTSDLETYDGMLTDNKEVCLITIHADCTPVFVVDRVHNAIGLCHAGWRGTVDGIAGNLIDDMQSEFGSDPKDLICAIGPHIGVCCFEVGQDVGERFEVAFPGAGCVNPGVSDDKRMVDLSAATAYQFYKAGIQPENVNIAHLCTKCSEDMFHSFRRDGRNGGAMASFLMME